MLLALSILMVILNTVTSSPLHQDERREAQNPSRQPSDRRCTRTLLRRRRWWWCKLESCFALGTANRAGIFRVKAFALIRSKVAHSPTGTSPLTKHIRAYHSQLRTDHVHSQTITTLNRYKLIVVLTNVPIHNDLTICCVALNFKAASDSATTNRLKINAPARGAI